MTVANAGLQALVAGPPGKSAYTLAVDQGYTGTLGQWLASLQGANGVGVPGAPGPAGPPGQAVNPVAVTASGTLPSTATYVGVKTIPSGGLTLQLPPSLVHGTGVATVIVDETGTCSTANPITLTPSGSDTLQGDTSIIMNQPWQKITLISNGSNLWV